MKKQLVVFILIMTFPVMLQSQRSRRISGNSTKLSFSFNYNSNSIFYTTFDSFTSDNRTLILDYLTPVSGTFEVVDLDSITIDRSRTINFPQQIINIGFGIQFLKKNGTYHEFSLTELYFGSSEDFTRVKISDLDENVIDEFFLGTNEKYLRLGIRYEYGKYFGDIDVGRMIFGLGVAAAPKYLSYNSEVFSSTQFPVSSKIFSFNLAFVPSLFVKFSDHISMDMKLLPNYELFTIERAKQLNPFDPFGRLRRRGNRNINFDFSILFSYNIESQRTRRR